ncbi:MAG: hypothetical protein H6Q84_2783 [Deltaproteobacteria bacterium]|nr:hypothetical protein [Deltaproteobacteria bacterium]
MVLDHRIGKALRTGVALLSMVFSTSPLLSVRPALAAEGMVEGVKEGAVEVGRGAKEMGQDVGTAAKEAGIAVGKAAKEAGKEAGKAFQEAGKEIRDGVQGKK